MARPVDLSQLTQEVAGMRNLLSSLRRHFHTFPELSGEEKETAAFIAGHLEALGLKVERGVGGHGVVGVLAGTRAGPTLGYRADMDALPIQDTLEKPYSSVRLGVKHACGHDVHMAIALGVAELLSRRTDRFGGCVVFLFQPAEESLDGARAMIQSGVLSDYHLSYLLALHAFPIPAGSIGTHPDLCLAGMEEFRVRFYAPAGNLEELIARASARLVSLSTGSPPQDAVEFRELARQMVESDTLRKTIFLSCWPHTEGSLPPWHLLGLVSMTDFAYRLEVRAQIHKTLDAVVAGYGATYDLDYTFTNPPLRNHRPLVERISPVLEEVISPSGVITFRDPYPFAHEDFAIFAEMVPSAFIWLGTANPEAGIPSLLHTPAYDVDEEALAVGTKAMTAVLLHLLD